MSDANSKFVQLATIVREEIGTLYALDDQGVVWWFSDEDNVWYPIPEDRVDD